MNHEVQPALAFGHGQRGLQLKVLIPAAQEADRLPALADDELPLTTNREIEQG
jgi:hypothetical protein